MAHDYDVVGHMFGDQFYCDDDCSPDLLGYEADETIFMSNGVEHGTVCDSCGNVYDEFHGWLPPEDEEVGIEAMRVAVERDGDGVPD